MCFPTPPHPREEIASGGAFKIILLKIIYQEPTMARFHDKFQAFRTEWYLNFQVFLRGSRRSVGPKTSILNVFWVSDCFEKLMEATKSILRKNNLFSLLHCFEL